MSEKGDTAATLGSKRYSRKTFGNFAQPPIEGQCEVSDFASRLLHNGSCISATVEY